ncbi:MAG: DoxX family protein [Phycisphaerae bacterium]|jgi:uncharacterized membrane protein YphA (DoxX/SURF4 family)
MAGSSIAPLFLRLALAATFLWAGFGKILETIPVKGQAAATLATMGIVTPADGKTKDTYNAADFPDDVRVRQVHGITLMLATVNKGGGGGAAGEGGAGGGGASTMPLVPAVLTEGPWPARLAWASAITELVGGLFVLVGLLTRLAGFSLACTMLGAIWLTQIGPAIQAGRTVLGFIPDHPPYATDAAGSPLFAMLLWQVSLLCIGLSLTFSGPGALSFDRALFPGGKGKRAAADED